METLTLWQEYERILLALTIWREASNQRDEARIAVGCSIMNRVERPSWWGRTLLQVLTKAEQYTSINTKTNDPNLRRWPQDGDPAFEACYRIATGILAGVYNNPFPGADSYYDTSIPEPWWAKKQPESYVGASGQFRFFNMDMDIEAPRAPITDTEG